MNINEEIDKLKVKLDKTSIVNEQGEVLLDILHKYASVNSNEGRPYIQKLAQTAEITFNDKYKGWASYYQGNYDKILGNYIDALFNTKKALALFKNINYHIGIAASNNNLGNIYDRLSDYSSALSYYQNALNFFQLIEDSRGVATAYNNIGNIYDSQGNFTESLSYYLASLKIFEQLSDKLHIGVLYNGIGLVYKQQGNYNEAISYYLASLKIKEEFGDRHGIASSYNNLGIIFHEQCNYHESLNYHLLSLKMREEIGDKNGIAVSHNNIGNAYRELGKHSDALTQYSISLKIFREIGSNYGIAHSNISIGQSYTGLKKYQKAIHYLLKGLKVAKDIGKATEIKHALKALYELKKVEKDGMAALEYYEKFVAVEKELVNTETQNKIAGLQFGYQIEKKELEIVFERKKKEELQVSYDLLDKEKKRSEELLLNILPETVSQELREKGSVTAKSFENVTVFFSDFKGFTIVSEKLSPQQLVDELHICFSAFDRIMEKYGIEKIKTVGDAYLAVSGLPLANPNHAYDLVNAALEIRNFMLERNESMNSQNTINHTLTSSIQLEHFSSFEVRIGIHSGPVVAGIVGIKKFAYDIWGDTVNTAARMEQNGETGKINISEATYKLVKDKFETKFRGEIPAKNKGNLKMYFVC